MATFAAKKVIEIIVADIKENFDPGIDIKVYNFFGLELEKISEKFFKANSIIVVYEGADYETKTNISVDHPLLLHFLVVEQLVATATKEKYLFDHFRDFIAWREFTGLTEEYAELSPEPFFPDRERLYDRYSGIMIWLFSGQLNMEKKL